jgi:hypothetical protein
MHKHETTAEFGIATFVEQNAIAVFTVIGLRFARSHR